MNVQCKGSQRARSKRQWLGVFGLAALGCNGCSGEAPSERVIVATEWDTTLVVGSREVGDTVLISPQRVRAWDGQVVVLERLVREVRVFDLEGRKRWTFGRRGSGPWEIGSAEEIFVDSDGNLRIWDGGNRKVIRLSPDGRAIDEKYFRNLWGLSTLPIPYGDRFLWTQLATDRPAYITDTAELEVIDSVRIDWPVPEDLPRRPDLMGFSAGFGDGWVTGLWVGPFFAVGGPGGVEFHPYIKKFHFRYAPGRWSAADPSADSAYFGTWDVSVVGEEIFFLSGGRPKTRAHDGEPTRFIDIYGLDGKYRRSYELPFHSRAMSTDDGETFYVLTLVDEVYPHLFGLRPRIR